MQYGWKAYFNSRLCMRGNLAAPHPRMRKSSFQFTPLHERQPSTHFYSFPVAGYFNSRLCMRGNAHFSHRSSIVHVFQFTPLHERQLFCLTRQSDYSVFQFTPLHERQQMWSRCIAPPGCYFNLRLCMRGNPMLFVNEANLYKFQFTPLHERQHNSKLRIPVHNPISIHASA